MCFKLHNLNRSRGLPQKFKTRLNLAKAESKLIVLLQLTSLGFWVVTDRRVDPTKMLLLGLIILDLWILELRRVMELFQDICEPYVHYIYIPCRPTYGPCKYINYLFNPVCFIKINIYLNSLMIHSGF